MKWYWHLFFLILATVAAWFAGDWLNQPLWQIVEPHWVSFDQCDAVRQEWTTLSGDSDRKNWWIETRTGRDPTVIRRVKLELPPLTGEYPYYGTNSGVPKMSCHAVLCHEWVREILPTGERLQHRYYILDPATGKELRRFTILNTPIGKIAGHGNKLAFVEDDCIKLFDVASRTERSVRLDSGIACLTFSPDGKLLACVSEITNIFYFIDWEKAALIEPISPPQTVGSFSFITNDNLLLVHNRPRLDLMSLYARWRWDGRELKQISPGIQLMSRQSLPLIRMAPNGELHLCLNAVIDWPPLLRVFFHRLADQNIPIEKWVSKKGYDEWLVLDNQDHLQRVYFEGHRGWRRTLYDHLSVEMEPDESFTTTTITFWNEHPVWPNTLAVGVVVYLLLYVMVLGWQRRRVHRLV